MGTENTRFGQVAQGRKTQEACLGMRLKCENREYTELFQGVVLYIKRRKRGQY